jgi:Protein of unknown function (DUF3619)
MTHAYTQQTDILLDRFGFKVAGALASANEQLSYDISERLRASRMQALSKRKIAPVLRTAPVVINQGGAAALTWGGSEHIGFWNGLGSVLPLIALVLGMLLIQSIQDERRVTEMAAVDAALLTDDLPPEAYLDAGFAQFLKHQR